MMWKLFCVYDRKAEVYLPPMSYAARGQAVRDFGDALNGETPMAKHPEDYTLYFVGQFDDSKASISVPEDGAESVVSGSSLVLPKTGGM